MIIVCVVTDVIGSLALVHEPPERDLMSRPPRASTDRLFDWKLFVHAYGFIGMMEAFAAFLMFGKRRPQRSRQNPDTTPFGPFD